MILIAGTVPDNNLPLTFGPVLSAGNSLIIGKNTVACTQGTGAMVSAALKTLQYLNTGSLHVLLAGDTGKGDGSRNMYEYLISHFSDWRPEVLALHYCLPDIALMKRLIATIEKCPARPLLIADAGSMYAAKAAGLAPSFDIFTPDAAEAAFLADPLASHPAYVKYMMYDHAGKMPELINKVYKNKCAAKYMLVKGATDYIVKDGAVLETVSEPDVPAMEPIGGTGDTITGMVTAFTAVGLAPQEAMVIAAKANRMAGKTAAVNPASRVNKIIEVLPEVFKNNLCSWSGSCIK